MTTPTIKKSDSVSDTEPFSFHDEEEEEDTPTPFLKSRPLPTAAPPFIIPSPLSSNVGVIVEKRIELPLSKVEGIIRRQNAFVFPRVADEDNNVVPLMNIEKIKL
jgi:hypothetical protein